MTAMDMRLRFTGAVLGLTLITQALAAGADSQLVLNARYRAPIEGTKLEPRVMQKTLNWDARKTAIIICDVWDKHWCNGANVRLGPMLDRMNRTVENARARGALIIHAPSDCMEFYKDTPQRKLAMSAPAAKNVPADISRWCSKLKGEPADPIDSSDGGCDDQPRCKEGKPYPWTRQHPAIRIADNDAVSDKGVEVWNLLESRGIENVMVFGVHTNMCVSGRPFGMRNLSRYGKNVVLIRDLTDTMYNPRKAPFVAHNRGTELMIEHIERYICPSILSSDLLGDPKPQHAVFIIGEDEYKLAETLPEFGKTELAKLGIRCTFFIEDPKKRGDFSGLEQIKDADLLVVATRRRAPKQAQMDFIRRHLDEGKPLIGIRTATHGFDLRGKAPDGSAVWPTFDVDVLGGHYENHYGNGPIAFISVSGGAAAHPILTGWPKDAVKSPSSLYISRDLAKTATPLLVGSIDSPKASEPVAWTNVHKGARIFYTSLGGPEDLAAPAFRRMLANAFLWTLDRPIP